MEREKELSDLLDFSAMFVAGSSKQTAESSQVERLNKDGNKPSCQNQEGQSSANQNELTAEQKLKQGLWNLTSRTSPRFEPMCGSSRLSDPYSLNPAGFLTQPLSVKRHTLPEHSKTPAYQPQGGLSPVYSSKRRRRGPQIFRYSLEEKLPEQEAHRSFNIPSSSSHPIYEEVQSGLYDENVSNYTGASLPETPHQLGPSQPVTQDQSDQDFVRLLSQNSTGSSGSPLKYLIPTIGSTSRGQVGVKAQQLSDHRGAPTYIPQSRVLPKYPSKRKRSERPPSQTPLVSFSAENVASSDSDTDSDTEQEKLVKGRYKKIFKNRFEDWLPDQNAHLSSNFPSSSTHPICEDVQSSLYNDEDVSNYIEASLHETPHQLRPSQPVTQDQSDQDIVRGLSPSLSPPHTVSSHIFHSRDKGMKSLFTSPYQHEGGLLPEYPSKRKRSRSCPSETPTFSFSAKHVESSDSGTDSCTDSATEQEELGKGRFEEILGLSFVKKLPDQLSDNRETPGCQPISGLFPVITPGFSSVDPLLPQPYQVRKRTYSGLPLSSLSSHFQRGLPDGKAHPPHIVSSHIFHSRDKGMKSLFISPYQHEGGLLPEYPSKRKRSRSCPSETPTFSFSAKHVESSDSGTDSCTDSATEQDELGKGRLDLLSVYGDAHHQQPWSSSCLETHTTDTESMNINLSVPCCAGSVDQTILKELGGGLLSDISDLFGLVPPLPTPMPSTLSGFEDQSSQPLRSIQQGCRFVGLNREDIVDRGTGSSSNSKPSDYILTCSPSRSPTTLDPDCQHPSVTEESKELWDLTSDLDVVDTAVICPITNTLPPSSQIQTRYSSSPDWSQGAPRSFPRSHSSPSLCHMTSADKKTLRRACSLPDLLLKTSCEQFTPDISADGDDETYRFQCSIPGLYQCSVTSLVFHMKREGDVVYRSVTWNRKLLSQHHKQPAGPLFDIKCEQQSMCQLHLPHCEIPSTGGGLFLSVAHVNDEGMEFIVPHKITESHVIINVSGFSDFGIVRDEDSPAVPVRALVLLFYQPPVDPKPSSLLNVLMLPRNVVLRDVLRTRKKLVGDERYTETSPYCRLHPQQEYSLSTCPDDNSVLVEPTTAEFDIDDFDNYFPSFQVRLEQTMDHIKLFLKHNDSSLSVWERRVCLQSSGVQRSCGQSAPNLPSCQKLFEIRSGFIEGVSGPVLKSVLDKLFEKTVMTDSERESAEAIPDKRDKARFVIDTVKNKGGAASSEMIEALCDIDPFLCEHLGLM
ncbi:uncharacterized protein LOC121527747 [Cheilinus undulatus]|uniref:uncharacterized protein LOC121527747 n=1 Tax=Cheilinus undulatus TaxID=241271 RepID=UPI001BD5712F|nr:uncharacterized protein LOC121527747 [Cheilinus undulatus]